nr:immunoglobulin heavy chain junction region [Macaca mulatta]
CVRDEYGSGLSHW